MVINNKTLFNSNLYGQMFINESKNGLLVKVTSNVFNRSTNDFNDIFRKFFDKPSKDILEGVESKSKVEQLDTLVSFYARNNSIHEIETFNNCIKFSGNSQVLSLSLKSKKDGTGEVVKKLVKKYNEDRIRFYGKNSICTHYVINTGLNLTGYVKDKDKIVFNLDREYKNDKKLHLIPIDEKFLSIFLREQVINKNGEVIMEKDGCDNIITIGDVVITYSDDLEEVFRLALLKRDNRIFEEKTMQYKLDI